MRLFVQLTDSKTIHIAADRLEIDRDNNMLLAYHGEKLVAVTDLSTVLYAHISERRDNL